MPLIVSWAEQEDESLSLLWAEAQITQIKKDLCDLVSMVNTGISVLPDITMGILVESQPPFEIWNEVLLFFHHLSFGPKLVIERVTLLLLEPVWDLVVSHVLYFHFPRH